MLIGLDPHANQIRKKQELKPTNADGNGTLARLNIRGRSRSRRRSCNIAELQRGCIAASSSSVVQDRLSLCFSPLELLPESLPLALHQLDIRPGLVAHPEGGRSSTFSGGSLLKFRKDASNVKIRSRVYTRQVDADDSRSRRSASYRINLVPLFSYTLV